MTLARLRLRVTVIPGPSCFSPGRPVVMPQSTQATLTPTAAEGLFISNLNFGLEAYLQTERSFRLALQTYLHVTRTIKVITDTI
jgi:hypothetical protein